jgi:hypothetical protein
MFRVLGHPGSPPRPFSPSSRISAAEYPEKLLRTDVRQTLAMITSRARCDACFCSIGRLVPPIRTWSAVLVPSTGQKLKEVRQDGGPVLKVCGSSAGQMSPRYKSQYRYSGYPTPLPSAEECPKEWLIGGCHTGRMCHCALLFESTCRLSFCQPRGHLINLPSLSTLVCRRGVMWRRYHSKDATVAVPNPDFVQGINNIGLYRPGPTSGRI